MLLMTVFNIMVLHRDSHVHIYFGDSNDQLFMDDDMYDNLSKREALLDCQPFAQLPAILGIDNLIFARQVHGTQVHKIDKQTLSTTKSFTFKGDALVTQEMHTGLGVLTADCLPIVIYDTVRNAVSIVHAGWRSTVENITFKTLAFMNALYGTTPTDVKVYFGPCAGPCCYSVGIHLIDSLSLYRNETIHYKNGIPYFDNRLYNQLALQAHGVPASAFCLDYNLCTICNHQFWSFRRQQEQAGRQMTIVTLNAHF